MQKTIDNENNLQIMVDLDNLTQEDISFFNEFHSKAFNLVLQFAMRDITTYDMADSVKRLGFSFVCGDDKGRNKIYLRSLKNKERYHFYY